MDEKIKGKFILSGLTRNIEYKMSLKDRDRPFTVFNAVQFLAALKLVDPGKRFVFILTFQIGKGRA